MTEQAKREIKFRGKTKQGKWVYGYYLPWHAVKTEDRADVYAQIFEEKDEKHAKGWVFVKANTVGQYTGLKDKNGKEIYEGDVVASVFTSGEFCNVGDVQFDCGVFGVEWKPCKKNKSMLGSFGQRHNLRRLDDEMIDHIEVIGNIHDNPELLEENND